MILGIGLLGRQDLSFALKDSPALQYKQWHTLSFLNHLCVFWRNRSHQIFKTSWFQRTRYVHIRVPVNVCSSSNGLCCMYIYLAGFCVSRERKWRANKCQQHGTEIERKWNKSVIVVLEYPSSEMFWAFCWGVKFSKLFLIVYAKSHAWNRELLRG